MSALFLKADVLNPAEPLGAIVYAVLFFVAAFIASSVFSTAVAQILKRDQRGLIDRTVASFLTHLAKFVIYIVALILYAHLVPGLSHLGTALLAGASVVSVVIGLAAQNTLGNMVSGVSLLIFRPFEVGDKIQVTAPTGLETGQVQAITLGFTVLCTSDNRRIVIPNSAMSSQTTVNITHKNVG